MALATSNPHLCKPLLLICHGGTIKSRTRQYGGWPRIQFVFFVLTIVILMNLSLRCMAITFSSVASNAEAEYQMQFAKLVKCYESTVFQCPSIWWSMR